MFTAFIAFTVSTAFTAFIAFTVSIAFTAFTAFTAFAVSTVSTVFAVFAVLRLSRQRCWLRQPGACGGLQKDVGGRHRRRVSVCQVSERDGEECHA